jgi:hypothetical protein
VVCGVLGCGALSGLAVPAAARPVSPYLQLGKFAGYAWNRGPVTSVSASWRVPHISGSRLGGQLTWIGAEGPAAGPPVATTAVARRGAPPAPPTPAVPFIQVGTLLANMRVFPGGPTVKTSLAMWSDTNLGYILQPLEVVRPGDMVSARLTLAAHRWAVSITDLTTHVTKRFTTEDQGDERFNSAGWLDEDVFRGPTGNPKPLPALSPTRMMHLAVNATPPRYQDLRSLWMSENGEYLAPSALSGDAFSIGKANLTRAGVAYLGMAGLENRAARTFGAQLAKWTAATSRSQIASQCSGFGRVLRRSLHRLAIRQWPTAAGPSIRTLERRTRALLAWTNAGARVSPQGRPAWRTKWRADARAAHGAGSAVRRALHAPEFV